MIPRCSGLAGNQLRHAARLMASCARAGGARTSTAAILILQLAALAEAAAELRQAQQRAAQARAALTAAQRLHTVRPAPPAKPRAPPRARTAAGLAAQPFTGPPIPSRNSRTATGARPGPLPRARPADRHGNPVTFASTSCVPGLDLVYLTRYKQR